MPTKGLCLAVSNEAPLDWEPLAGGALVVGVGPGGVVQLVRHKIAANRENFIFRVFSSRLPAGAIPSLAAVRANL
jgi:hypothetical protein